jgi:GxxExxY protein
MSMIEIAAIPTRTEIVAAQIVDAAVKVHKALAPGLLESIYEACLCRELAIRSVPFKTQLALPIMKGYDWSLGYELTYSSMTVS